MNLDLIKEFYRQKRIRRILNIYSRLQPSAFTGKRRQKPSLVSRDAMIYFGLVMLSMMLVGVFAKIVFTPFFKIAAITSNPVVHTLCLLPTVASAYLAVELADYLLIKLTSFFDTIFDFVLPALIGILFLIIYVGLKNYDMGEKWKNGFEAWRTEMNQNLQSRPIDIRLKPLRGSNWAFALNEKNQVIKMTKEEAKVHCVAMGAGWGLYNPSLPFIPEPVAQFDRAFFIWQDGGGFAVGQLDPQRGIAKPVVFSSSGSSDKNAVLCIFLAGGRQ